jgi:hypothetical protein
MSSSTCCSNFQHFVRRIQSRDKKKDECLDLFLLPNHLASNADEGETTNDAGTVQEGTSQKHKIRAVRVFLSHLDCQNQDRFLQRCIRQINALSRAKELQIHVSLDNGDENNEKMSSNVQDLAVLFYSIQSLLKNVTSIPAVKLLFYAKERHGASKDHCDANDIEEEFNPRSFPSDSACCRSSVESIQIVLVTSSIFTSFAPTHGDKLPILAKRLVQSIVKSFTTTLPNLQHVCLECDRSQCWAMETNYASPPTIAGEWLEEIEAQIKRGTNTWTKSATILPSTSLSLEIKGWKLDWSSMRCLCRILRASEDENGPKCTASSPPLRILHALTLTHCRWALELRNSEAKNIHDPGCDLGKALAENTTLRSLCLDLAMIPSPIFSRKGLAHALAVHPKLKSFRTTMCMKEQAFASLLEAYHESSLEEISIPYFFGTWTEELLSLLRKVLFRSDQASSASLSKISLRLQHVPARWCADPAPAHRRNVWSLWKEYLQSSCSDTLQDLVVMGLTPEEQLDLVSVMQHRNLPLRSLRFKGCTSLSTVVELTQQLGSHELTRALPTHFEFEVWNGDELHATKTLLSLAHAMKQHYGILTMDLSCAEYSATPHADILRDLYKDTDAVARIHAILALNKAGRRHMLANPHCLVLGTTILAQVALQHSVDAIFHHVMEHPGLVLGGSSGN